MNWSLIISICALFFSILTYFINDRKIKKQEKAINAYQLEKITEEKSDKKKALIKANLIKGHNKMSIKIFNVGKGIAKNVRYELTPPDAFLTFNSSNFPFELLNPQEGTELSFSLRSSAPSKVNIRLIWDDDSNENNEYEQVLTLY